MSYQFSPDGHYLWDGARWVSAVSPDGAWRWDGTAWRPAAASARANNGRATAIIAVGIVLVLLVGGVGLFALTRVAIDALQSQLGVACSGRGNAGQGLAQGDTVCGRALGPTLVAADCTTAASLPSALEAKMTTSGDSSWAPAYLVMDSLGCHVLAQPNHYVAIESSDEAGADAVLVADFVPRDSTGSVGLQIACSEAASCLDVSVSGDQTYSLDEGVPDAGWKSLTNGPTILGHLRFGQANRLILRFVDGVASVYLNGYEVTHSTPDLAQESGYFRFYADDGGGSTAEQVVLQRIYAFQAL